MTDQRQKILERGSYFPGDWVRPRLNPGTWMAMVDVAEVFTGHRSLTRDGRYEMFDGPIGVQLRVEEADKSELLLTPEREGGRTSAGAPNSTRGRPTAVAR